MKAKRTRKDLNTITYEFPKSESKKFPMKKLPYISTMDLIYQNSQEELLKSKLKSTWTHK